MAWGNAIASTNTVPSGSAAVLADLRKGGGTVAGEITPTH